jgi:SAM-dependent methyltransferase
MDHEFGDLATSFGRAAGSYERGRPDYPVEAVAWMLERVPAGSRVLDIGAGTGKLTRAVAGLGHRVAAVDPDPLMLESLRESVAGVATAVGTAEELPFDDGSFDAVVGGQMWHWVDPVLASREVGRVLAPGGWLGLIWNVRDVRVPWVAEFAGIVGSSAAEELIDKGGVEVGEPFGDLERLEVEWTRSMTPDTVMEMVWSRSSVITADAKTRGGIARDVTELMSALLGPGAGGEVSLPYRTLAFRARRL